MQADIRPAGSGVENVETSESGLDVSDMCCCTCWEGHVGAMLVDAFTAAAEIEGAGCKLDDGRPVSSTLHTEAMSSVSSTLPTGCHFLVCSTSCYGPQQA